MPTSAGESFRFAVINLNFSDILSKKLDHIHLDKNSTWFGPSGTQFIIPRHSTWTDIWNITCCKWPSSDNGSNPSTCNHASRRISTWCTYVEWWPPYIESDSYNHEFTVEWNTEWCIEIPNTVGPEITDRGEHINYKWAWTWKTYLHMEKNPDNVPLSAIPRKNWTKSDKFSCKKVLNCTTGAGDPIETWCIPELRTFIRDMCTCWGYPNLGFQNNNMLCDK